MRQITGPDLPALRRRAPVVFAGARERTLNTLMRSRPSRSRGAQCRRGRARAGSYSGVRVSRTLPELSRLTAMS